MSAIPLPLSRSAKKFPLFDNSRCFWITEGFIFVQNWLTREIIFSVKLVIYFLLSNLKTNEYLTTMKICEVNSQFNIREIMLQIRFFVN